MDAAVRERFWAGLGTDRRRDLTAWPAWEERLAAALNEPARTWSADWLSAEEFGAELGGRLEADDAEVERWWQHLHPSDLYLASACARGVVAAIARFERTYGEEMARTARRFERPGLPADDLLQFLRAKLFGWEQPRPRIAAYSGQGFLQNWVRVTTTRTFIDCSRAEAHVELPIADELVAALPEPGADPELELLKREHAGHCRQAFAEAVARLDSSDRLVLKHHLVDRLTAEQIAALYAVHRATAARRIVKAREALLEAAREALARRLGMPPARLTSILELVASRLVEVSVERLLR